MTDKKEKTNGVLGDWLYKGLFEQVPFNIAVIDRNFNIVDANKNFRDYFGRWKKRKCYEVYKNLDKPCVGCNALLTFQDGEVRVSDESGINQHGSESHYVVHIAPLKKSPRGKVEYIVEMSRDIIETKNLQMQYQLLFERVPCYVTVIDRNFKIIRANEKFRRNFGEVTGKQCYEVYKKRRTRCPNCPAARTFKDGQVHHSDQVGITKDGDKAHYMLTTSPLSRDIDNVPHVIEMSVDMTEKNRLEQEVIEAERLAAVGQTVAGLAHSIKNLLMGLEGGMYIVDRGLKTDKKDMISEGWDMLERNLTKTTSLVKDFLSFAKGRLPKLDMVNPNNLVREIVDLYGPIAEQSGVKLIAHLDSRSRKLPLDAQGIHTCLTNLVSNAIDACLMSKQKKRQVDIAVENKKRVLTFRVSDNGTGIDYDIKKKLFTTFFTTKGGQGTGLGLLTTRKIVKEHGGDIVVESKENSGSSFAMSFPKKNLTMLHKQNSLKA